MFRFVKQLFWSALSGTLLAVLGGAAYRSYGILRAGYALDSVPPLTMALDVMHLDLLAAYGAVAGVSLSILIRLLRLVVRTARRLFARAPAVVERSDPDSIIRAERAQLADSYLSSLGDRSLDNVLVTPQGDDDVPDVENLITARGGKFTYRVLAYRHLSERERMDVVREALRLGHVSEPESGGTATVMTAIGK
jgi:hypothetical protein